MIIRMVDCEKTILEEIANSEIRATDIAQTYAFCLISSEKIDFFKINMAILGRFSGDAFVKIKREAWKLVKEKRCKSAST